MTVAKVIRYQTKPGCADENARLIGRVFAQLAEDDPGGIRYTALRLADGVTFLHVAVLEGEQNPLSASSAFEEFQSTIGERVVEGPSQSDAEVVGSYRMQTG
jgi:hypothetical protein